ncbi:MAG: DUF2894 domain-containing protein [Betaproteobacteria bacterium]|nr:DUF2894 domain-containing protein [Betaproteobacteria bacterium]
MTDASHAMPALLKRMRHLPARPRTAIPRKGLDALKALNRSLQSIAAVTENAATASSPTRTVEMKSVQQFRQSWQRMKVQDQVEHALQQGPANAGPLNSHRLVLRTLGLMQDLSPAYLHHFMNHLDTMLQLDTMTLPQATKPARGGKRRLK